MMMPAKRYPAQTVAMMIIQNIIDAWATSDKDFGSIRIAGANGERLKHAHMDVRTAIVQDAHHPALRSLRLLLQTGLSKKQHTPQ